MLTAFNQNWHTTNLPYSLALANTVNTGGSFTTSSGAVRNSKIWASAGFRGLGPVLTFPGAGMDGMGCGCGCGGGCGHGSGLSGLTFDGTGHFTVTLDNGQVWRQVPGDVSMLRQTQVGSVRIARSVFGSYDLSLPGLHASYRVVRIQ